MVQQSTRNSTILGLDVGNARVGIARAGSIARLPSPHGVWDVDDTIFERLANFIQIEKIDEVVIGLPRNMSGEETAQSKSVREFAENLEKQITVPVHFADETLSSVRAEASKDPSLRAPSDDIAACFILEEYFRGDL